MMNTSSLIPAEIAYNGDMKILVIEDDREAADYLKKAFAEAGHTVHLAADGDGRNSPYAAALLKHLGTPGMELSQTMRRVMADVSSMTGDRQRPWINSDLAVDFYLLPAAVADAIPAAPRPQMTPTATAET